MIATMEPARLPVSRGLSADSRDSLASMEASPAARPGRTWRHRVPHQTQTGGQGRNRTGVDGFAGRCMTTLPPGPTQAKKPRLCAPGAFAGSGAGNETRTRDPDLGKVVLYQL